MNIAHCAKCGESLSADAPAGLCPKCLLQGGFPSEFGPSGTRGTTGFQPPTARELAASFPQLEILELLGQGGMGAVYKARQPGLDRLVAVKILPPQVGRDPAFAERFLREARALARLSHPNIVGVHDFGKTPSPRPSPRSTGEREKSEDIPPGELYYFIMEYVEGANLRQAIQTGKLQSAEALAIVPQICEALQYAHDEGVVHRDIKPENILLDKKGRVKIADFGLSKLLGDDEAEANLTGTNQVMGTLRYMAPEQMHGTKAVDHRADIYSLGVVFYELLTGDVPLGRFDPPSHRVQIDVRLDEVVLRALAQEPDKRYQRASEVKTQIDSIRIQPVQPPPATPAWPKPPELSPQVPVATARRKVNVGFLVCGLLMLAMIPVFGAVILILLRSGEGPSWLILFGAGIVTLTLLLVSGVLIMLGLLGRRARAGGATTADAGPPARSTNEGAVALVVILVLAVTCLPGLLLIGAVGLLGFLFVVTPVRTMSYDEPAQAIQIHEERVTLPQAEMIETVPESHSHSEVAP